MYTFEQIVALQTEYKWTANQILDLIKADGSEDSKNPQADKAPTTKKSKTSKSVSASKKPAAKTSKKSSGSSPKEKKSRDERLTEKYGPLPERKKFVALKTKISAEFSELYRAEGIAIPRKQYNKVLTATAELLEGKKFDKKVVRAEFLKAAK